MDCPVRAIPQVRSSPAAGYNTDYIPLRSCAEDLPAVGSLGMELIELIELIYG